MSARRIFVIAGENSGDQHAANLIRSLKRREPEWSYYGLGGSQMAEAGVEIIENIVDDLAIVGLTPVIRNLGKIMSLFRLVHGRLERDRPDAIVLVDYPGFNLRVAKMAKDLGIPVIYFICPQVWGWHYSRVFKIAEVVDLALVIFPFEKRIFEEVGVNVRYIGHPLLDTLRFTRDREEICEFFGLDPSRPLIGMMPGSRRPEVIRHLSVMLEACERIREKMPGAQFVVFRSTTIESGLLDKYIQRSNVRPVVVDHQRLNMRRALDFCLVKSGTSTLETGAMETPMIIIYKVSFLSWFIGKIVIQLPFLGLVNIVADERIVPELLQDECTGEGLADEALSIMNDDVRRANMRFQLRQVTERLGGKGACERASALISGFLNPAGRAA